MMKYSTELADQIEIVDNKSKYLEAGIHDNVSLVSARVDKSINGNTFLEIKFSKDGKELTHTEWETNQKPNETEEQCQVRCSKQVKRIKQILECYYPKNALIFTGTSFKEFVDWVAGLLNSAVSRNVLVKVKVVYNSKGYTTLPNYCKFTFIEPMELPEGESSKITQLNIDQFTRPILADKETNENNPLEMLSTNTDDKNDLPF